MKRSSKNTTGSSLSFKASCQLGSNAQLKKFPKEPENIQNYLKRKKKEGKWKLFKLRKKPR